MQKKKTPKTICPFCGQEVEKMESGYGVLRTSHNFPETKIECLGSCESVDPRYPVLNFASCECGQRISFTRTKEGLMLKKHSIPDTNMTCSWSGKIMKKVQKGK